MGSGNETSAWRRASNSVALFLLVFPVAAVTLGISTLLYWLTGLGTHTEHRQWTQIVAGAVGLAIALLLDRRFQRFRVAPPQLGLEESRQDATLVLAFRTLSVGILIVIWLIGVLARKSGTGFLNGF